MNKRTLEVARLSLDLQVIIDLYCNLARFDLLLTPSYKSERPLKPGALNFFREHSSVGYSPAFGSFRSYLGSFTVLSPCLYPPGLRSTLRCASGLTLADELKIKERNYSICLAWSPGATTQDIGSLFCQTCEPWRILSQKRPAIPLGLEP